jgi:flagellar hook-length control protein FliK
MPEMLSVPQAPPAPSGAPDHAPSAGKETQGPPFKEVLKDHQARPAHAEGPKPHGDDSPKGTTPDTDATTQQGEATDPTATPATAVVQALALTLVAPTTPVVATAAAPVGAAAGTVAEAATPATTAPNAAVLAAVAETAAGVPAAVTGEAPAASDAAQPADAKPAGAIALPATATQADGKPVATAAATAAPAAATATATATTVPAQDTPAVAPAAAAPAAEAAVVAADTRANQPAAAPAPAPGQAPVNQGGPAPAQANQAPAPAAAPSPLNTAHAVERIQAMVHMAHARGAAHARIELHPAELGGVTIQLQVAHDGLRAHIAADRPEALPLLQRAAADLQRTLEARGIDLSGLDFGLAPDAEAGASRDDGRAEGRENPFGGPGRLGSDEESEAVEATVTTTTRSVELPAGALVDVRA